MSTREELARRALKLAEDRTSDAEYVIAWKLAFKGEQPTEAELEEYRAATIAFVLAYNEYEKTIKMEERQMSTREELARRALKLAEDRFSDAAIVIADKVAFEGKQPTEAELEEYRAATEAIARAHREYAKTIKK